MRLILVRHGHTGSHKYNGVTDLPIGTTVDCLSPHCDPTVNLYDHYHIVRGDTLVDIWPVDARGVI